MRKIIQLGQLGMIAMSVALLTSCGALGSKCAGDTITQQQATLASRTDATQGQEVQICRGGEKPTKMTMTIPTGAIDSNYKLTLDWQRSSNDKGRHHWDGACDDMDRSQHPTYEYVDVPVALTSESFGTVKLCYFDGSKTRIAISMVSENEPCPTGSVEQTQPVDDCSQLVTGEGLK